MHGTTAVSAATTRHDDRSGRSLSTLALSEGPAPSTTAGRPRNAPVRLAASASRSSDGRLERVLRNATSSKRWRASAFWSASRAARSRMSRARATSAGASRKSTGFTTTGRCVHAPPRNCDALALPAYAGPTSNRSRPASINVRHERRASQARANSRVGSMTRILVSGLDSRTSSANPAPAPTTATIAAGRSPSARATCASASRRGSRALCRRSDRPSLAIRRTSSPCPSMIGGPGPTASGDPAERGHVGLRERREVVVQD